MKKILSALLLLASMASAEVTFRNGHMVLNGVEKEHVIGRSSFKLANIVTYHYTGQGGGKYSLGYADQWIEHNQRIFGQDVFLRVLLETAGWSPCDEDNGVPENCMFGSEPRDQGFWNVNQLRQPPRIQELTAVGKKTVEYFFERSQSTGVGFELVIIATLKHDDVTVGQQTHVIRQTLSYMRLMQIKYPRANILANLINEWNAHSQWTLAEVNMAAVRADRCKHPDGRVTVTFNCPPGFEPEQWAGGPIVVDPGGGNTFSYDVGPEPGKFRMGLTHPDRGSGWEQYPTSNQLQALRADARGQPVGTSESMYYVEQVDRPRATQWYRSGGWSSNWGMMQTFYEHMVDTLAYTVFHDEKGVQCDIGWPREMTKLETWALERFGNGEPPPDPLPPPDPQLMFDHVIEFGFATILQRPAGQAAYDAYNPWFRECHADPERDCFSPFMDVLIRSEEYRTKNWR